MHPNIGPLKQLHIFNTLSRAMTSRLPHTAAASAVKVDVSRYFSNPYTAQMLGENEKQILHDQETSLKRAHQLLHKCQRHYSKRTFQNDDFGSLYHGSLGVRVYLPWKLAATHRALGHKEQANQYLQDAQQQAEKAVLSLSSRSYRRVTLLESPWVGAKALQIAIWNDLHQHEKAQKEAHQLAVQLAQSCTRLPSHENDVLYGRAGAVQAILFLRRVLDNRQIGRESVWQIVQEIIQEGRRYAALHAQDALSLLWEWHDTKYLGAAHGVVGILHTLLCLEASELTALDEQYGLHKAIQETLKGLNRYCWPSGNLDRSIKSSHSVDRLVHWCHGATGHILLLAKAHEVYDDKAYQDQAVRLARDVVWERGLLLKGVGLCHGISGSTYALMAAARGNDPTITERHVHAFVRFAHDNLHYLEAIPDEPYCLYNGVAGLCNLFLDIAVHGCQARFPLYDHF